MGSSQELPSFWCDVRSPAKENSGWLPARQNPPTFAPLNQAEPGIKPGAYQTCVTCYSTAPMAVFIMVSVGRIFHLQALHAQVHSHTYFSVAHPAASPSHHMPLGCPDIFLTLALVRASPDGAPTQSAGTQEQGQGVLAYRTFIKVSPQGCKPLAFWECTISGIRTQC